MTPPRYEQRPVGVFDRELDRVVLPTDSEWRDYQAHLARGHLPLPPPPVDVLQQQRRKRSNEVNARRMQALVAGVMYEGHRFATDPASRANITAALVVYQDGQPPADYTWRTVDNINVPMKTRVALRAFGAAVLAHVNACYARSFQLKAAIAASHDPAAIAIDAGWPA